MNPELYNVRMVIVVLGVVAILSLVGATLLAVQEKSIPDYLVASGSGSISAIGALLSKTSATPPT